ncbi:MULTISPECIES: curli production assembly/transport protein CsgE [Pseudomonas]|uniref:Curli production assembly/transport component CsgE n=3 Tax=Pseudomonas TaxID=286 RepID=A0ABS0MU94_PSELU|nr:curli production assembly/transport protein CsgE [Pseudomonas zeshuii]MBH3440045.1 curli production assembly/transport protein CsgE [Pseudomonas luteola]MBW5414687.1 curli production assembly/transport protein CsgE [Pseudomonas sp. MAG002Y]QEU29813.1 curli production assembly/transport protein CsgE [Pseudomonas luteola]SER04081.1 curli production assembly/transport component CsgE [Pseudomonas lutea]
MKRWGVGLLGMMMLMSAQAADDEENIQGFIVDNTISRFGHDFYRYFSDRLVDTSQLDFNLVVRERPSARWGSLVWVEHDQRVVYRQFIQPNVAELKGTAYAAADMVKDTVAKQKLENLLYDTFDMDRDEL